LATGTAESGEDAGRLIVDLIGDAARVRRILRGLAMSLKPLAALVLAGLLAFAGRGQADDASLAPAGGSQLFEPVVDEASAGNAGMFVGVGRFSNDDSLQSLAYATHDAVELAHLFVFELRLIAPRNCHVLLSSEPISETVAGHLDQLRKAGAKISTAERSRILLTLRSIKSVATAREQMLVCAFSSHGFEDRSDAYVMPADGVRDLLLETAVAIASIEKMMGESRAGHRLMLVDACQERITVKSTGEASIGSPASEAFAAALKVPTGQAKFASCSPGEFSFEHGSLGGVGHGIFTFQFLEALRGGAQADEQNIVRLGTVAEFVATNVTAWTKANKRPKQTPFLQSPVETRSLPLASKANDIKALIAEIERLPAAAGLPADVRASLIARLRAADLADPAERRLIVATRDFVRGALDADIFISFVQRNHPGPRTELSESVAEVRLSLKQMDFVAAYAKAELHRADHPDSQELDFLLWKSLHELDRPQEAEAALERMERRDPDSTLFHVASSLSLQDFSYTDSEFQASIEHAKLAVRRGDFLDDVVPSYAWACMVSDHYKEGVEFLERHLETHRDHAVALRELANLNGRLVPDAVLPLLDQAIAADPTDPLAYNYRGHYGMDDDANRALRDFDRAIELAPRYGNAYMGRASALIKLDRIDEALQAMSRGIQQAQSREKEHHDLIYKMGTLIELERLTEAEADLRRAAELFPDSAETWMARCELHFARQQSPEAIGAARHAAVLDPQSPEPHQFLAMIHYDRVEMPEAIAAMSAAIRVKPSARRYEYLAKLCLEEGRISQGLAALEDLERLGGDANRSVARQLREVVEQAVAAGDHRVRVQNSSTIRGATLWVADGGEKASIPAGQARFVSGGLSFHRDSEADAYVAVPIVKYFTGRVGDPSGRAWDWAQHSGQLEFDVIRSEGQSIWYDVPNEAPPPP
jgi:tetratricopeptide (TPR) repeat protein